MARGPGFDESFSIRDVLARDPRYTASQKGVLMALLDHFDRENYGRL